VDSYKPRIIDAEVASALGVAGAVLLEGPRGCGKTETGRFHADSEVLLDTDENAQQLAGIDPKAVLEGSTPRLIDEWQLEPRLWNHVRRTVDERRARGQFILTGSATPSEDDLRHSGAARILRLRMRTMSLSESGHSTAQVSLADLLDGVPLSSQRSALGRSVTDLASIVCRGGWPAMLNLSPEEAQRLLRSYLDDIVRIDLPKLEGDTRRDTIRVRRTLTSLARHSATEVTYAAIAADVSEPDRPARPETISQYLDLLERMFVIERQPSWGPHLRSRAVIRKQPKLHYVDPALAVAGIRGSPAGLLSDLKTFGFLFESLVARDLRVYGQALDARLMHYRDSSGTEVDDIVALPDGRWLAAEVKLGTNQIDAAAASLLAFVGKLDVTRTTEPAALVIFTTGEYAYERPDGVKVVPITMLGP
jgi:predicted AAA+ superfamily ATPase